MEKHTEKAMKVAIYTRVSTEDQAREGTSLEVQKEFLVSYAQREGWAVTDVYVDDGYSGYSEKRPALSRLMRDARLKKFDIVLCHKIDRFARNNRLLLNMVGQLNDMGIGFKSASESFDTVTAAGKMALSMLGTVAQFERDRIIERVFPGMIKGVERGNWQGSRYVPYGYSYNKHDPDKKLEVIKEEAEIVRLIYAMYLAGQSTPQIAGYLYKKGCKTRSGGLFHTKLVCDILKNKLYIGMLEWNRSHYDKKQKTLNGYKYVKNHPSKFVSGKGRHEAIISEDDFFAVQKKLSNNKNGVSVRKGSAEYPLTGTLICGNCGHRLIGALTVAGRRNGKTNWKRRYYRCCSRSTHYVDCHAPAAQSDKIEEEVYAIVDVVLSNPYLDDERINNLASILSTTRNEEIEQEISRIDNKLKENIASQEKLGKAFSDGLLAQEAFRNLILPLRDEQKKLEEKKHRLKLNLIEREKSEEYQRIIKAVINHLDFIKEDLDATGRKGLLKLMFRKVVVREGKVVDFELYEPFKSLYEGKGIKWEVRQRQEFAASISRVSALSLMDAR